jgi:hypothetical protein
MVDLLCPITTSTYLAKWVVIGHNTNKRREAIRKKIYSRLAIDLNYLNELYRSSLNNSNVQIAFFSTFVFVEICERKESQTSKRFWKTPGPNILINDKIFFKFLKK